MVYSQVQSSLWAARSRGSQEREVVGVRMAKLVFWRAARGWPRDGPEAVGGK